MSFDAVPFFFFLSLFRFRIPESEDMAIQNFINTFELKIIWRVKGESHGKDSMILLVQQNRTFQ